MTPSQLLKPNLSESALRLEQSRRGGDESSSEPRPASARSDREFGGDECATLNFLKSTAPQQDWQALLHEEHTLIARLLRVTEARGRLEIHLRAAGHDLDALRYTVNK
jgi:hypothetical protein